MNEQDFRTKMMAPFKASEIEWKLQVVSKDKSSGLAVPYIDSRAIQNRLDDVAGPMGWRTEFREWKGSAQICGISIYDSEKKEWVVKFDGSDDSDVEPIKGGLSDSFKRAATHWGIGRYLYSLGGCWVNVAERGSNKHRIADDQQGKLDKHYNTQLAHYLKGTSPPAPEPSKAPPRKAATPAAVKEYNRIESIQSNGSHCLMKLLTTAGKAQQVYAQVNPLFKVGVVLEDIETEIRKDGNKEILFMKSYRFYEQAAA